MAKDETCALEAHVCVCLCLLVFLTAAEKVVLEPHWRQVPSQSHATRFTRIASRVGCGKKKPSGGQNAEMFGGQWFSFLREQCIQYLLQKFSPVEGHGWHERSCMTQPSRLNSA